MNNVLTHDEHVGAVFRSLEGLRILAVAPAAVVATLILLWGYGAVDSGRWEFAGTRNGGLPRA